MLNLPPFWVPADDIHTVVAVVIKALFLGGDAGRISNVEHEGHYNQHKEYTEDNAATFGQQTIKEGNHWNVFLNDLTKK